MDDHSLASEHEPATYRCPGEAHAIDRAVHLGRLAAFYPACRQCAHRGEVQALTRVQVRQWEEVHARRAGGLRFTAEGLEGQSAGQLDGWLVRRFAGAAGVALWRGHDRAAAPAVLVATDGHWTTAELMAAACESLRLAGCRTLEAGAVTTASLTAAAERATADGALWIGNASGEPHSIALKLWGSLARPWSSPGDLDRVRAVCESNVDRPKRRAGLMERSSSGEPYLAPLRSLFHGLRPLRFVLDTVCQPLVNYLGRLNSRSACEVLRPRDTVRGSTGGEKPFLSRRLEVIGQQVLDQAAHFALWISGDGERCHVVDERGVTVEFEELFQTLAAYVCRQMPSPTLVIERQPSGELERALAQLGARIVVCDPTRQAASEAMHAAGAVLGGGSSGRFWYSGNAPSPDGLMTLSLLLTILSHSDRSLSEVLDAA